MQPHLSKCFENVNKLEFQKDLKMTAMYSGEGERVLEKLESDAVKKFARCPEPSLSP